MEPHDSLPPVKGCFFCESLRSRCSIHRKDALRLKVIPFQPLDAAIPEEKESKDVTDELMQSLTKMLGDQVSAQRGLSEAQLLEAQAGEALKLAKVAEIALRIGAADVSDAALARVREILSDGSEGEGEGTPP